MPSTPSSARPARKHQKASSALEALIAEDNRLARASREEAESTYAASATLTVIALLGGAGLGLVLVFLFARSLVGSMRGAVSVANDVAGGKLDGHIDVSRKDEVGDLMQAMQRMQRDLRERTETDQAIARENLRIRTALDYSSTGVYLTDNQLNIVYANRALEQSLLAVPGRAAQAPARVRRRRLAGRSSAHRAGASRRDGCQPAGQPRAAWRGPSRDAVR